MHLIDIDSLSLTEVENLFSQAKNFSENPWQKNLLSEKTIATIFFENSTRTRCSFELAAKRLGATVLNLDLKTSSASKGESLLDTIWTLEAMGLDAMIIRHSESGTCQFIKDHLKTHAKIINAGNGTKSHPTQALLDAFTIQQNRKARFNDLSIAIVGDIRHSRVAHSNIQLFKKLGVKDLRLVAPKEFLPEEDLGVHCENDLSRGLEGADVVMTLRIQKERITDSSIPNLEGFFAQYGLTNEKLKVAKPDVMVLHPGPMNRNVEIADEVADGPQSYILQQVENGVFIRQAVLERINKK